MKVVEHGLRIEEGIPKRALDVMERLARKEWDKTTEEELARQDAEDRAYLASKKGK